MQTNEAVYWLLVTLVLVTKVMIKNWRKTNIVPYCKLTNERKSLRDTFYFWIFRILKHFTSKQLFVHPTREYLKRRYPPMDLLILNLNPRLQLICLKLGKKNLLCDCFQDQEVARHVLIDESFSIARVMRTKAQVICVLEGKRQCFSIFYDLNMSTKSITDSEFFRVSFGKIP